MQIKYLVVIAIYFMLVYTTYNVYAGGVFEPFDDNLELKDDYKISKEQYKDDLDTWYNDTLNDESLFDKFWSWATKPYSGAEYLTGHSVMTSEEFESDFNLGWVDTIYMMAGAIGSAVGYLISVLTFNTFGSNLYMIPQPNYFGWICMLMVLPVWLYIIFYLVRIGQGLFSGVSSLIRLV